MYLRGSHTRLWCAHSLAPVCVHACLICKVTFRALICFFTWVSQSVISSAADWRAHVAERAALWPCAFCSWRPAVHLLFNASPQITSAETTTHLMPETEQQSNAYCFQKASLRVCCYREMAFSEPTEMLWYGHHDNNLVCMLCFTHRHHDG